jgi:hypothetical protein
VSIDLRNFFNCISRRQVRNIIKIHYPELFPFIDVLYKDTNTTYFLYPDGEWGFYSQVEGFTQGCPLSLILAALVLNVVLESVDKKTKKESNSPKKMATPAMMDREA